MHNILLLDTGIVGGLLSEIGDPSSRWNELVENMLAHISGSKYVVPTPVWYEIAQWHPGSFHTVQQKIKDGSPDIYQYAGYTIPNCIWMDAAWYKCQTRSKANNPDTKGAGKNKDPISMVDALIAAYSLRYGYYVLTLNNQDFPEKFFEIVCIKNAPSTTSYQRDFAALLKPKQLIWQESRSPEDTITPYQQELITRAKQAQADYRQGKGTVVHNEKELNEYFSTLEK